MLRRNKFGRFLKRGHKRRHHAKRRSNPHRRTRRRRHTAMRRRRRRSNPHMLLANPSQGSFSFHPEATMEKLQKYTVGAKAPKRKGAKRAGTKLSRKPRKRYRIYRGRGRAPKYRIFRRSNPFGAWLQLARLGVAGGLGIVAARISGRLYTDHVSKMVLGATGAADPKSFRAIANEALRIIAMGALPLVVERQVLRRVPMLTRADCIAFQLGALSEAGRQGIGVVLQKVKPGLDKGRWGLDGALPYVQYHNDGAYVYGLHPSGQWYAIGRSNGGAMNGLMPDGYMGGLEPEGAMGDLELAEDDDDGAA